MQPTNAARLGFDLRSTENITIQEGRKWKQVTTMGQETSQRLNGLPSEWFSYCLLFNIIKPTLSGKQRIMLSPEKTKAVYCFISTNFQKVIPAYQYQDINL